MVSTPPRGERPPATRSPVPPRSPGPLWVAAALAVLTAGVTAGCSRRTSTDVKADRSGPVRLLTYDAYVLPEQTRKALAAEGWSVEVTERGDAGELVAAAVVAQGRPEGDVMFGVDTSLLSRTEGAQIFAPLPADLAQRVPAPYRLAPESGVVAVDVGQVCVNADVAWFARHDVDLPTGFEDLADPRYRSLLVVENPAASSPGLMFLAGTVAVMGEARAQTYWKALIDNGAEIAGSWTDAYEGSYTVNGGDRPLVVSYGSSPPAEVVFSEGRRTEPASAVLEDTCVEQVEYAGVLAGAERPRGGEALLRAFLSDAHQRALPLTNFVFPIRDVPLPKEFAAWAVRSADPVRPDPELIAAGRDRWIRAWRSATG